MPSLDSWCCKHNCLASSAGHSLFDLLAEPFQHSHLGPNSTTLRIKFSINAIDNTILNDPKHGTVTGAGDGNSDLIAKAVGGVYANSDAVLLLLNKHIANIGYRPHSGGSTMDMDAAAIHRATYQKRTVDDDGVENGLLHLKNSSQDMAFASGA